MFFRKPPAFLFLVIFCYASAFAAPPNGQEIVDSIQPDAMLALFDTCAKGPAPAAQIRQILNFPGTKLLLKEHNRFGLVTEEQYFSMLDAACQGKTADIKPAEESARGRAGAKLLKQQIIPAALWGMQNTAALRIRLQQLRLNNGIKRTAAVAERNLPEKIILAPRYYIVMGGPTEAAAFDNDIYIDILQSLWHASRKQPTLSPHDVLVFFADGAHHAGYRKLSDNKRNSLELSPGEEQAWKLLQEVMVYGSATLLIDADEKPDNLAKLTQLKSEWKRTPNLLVELQKILKLCLKESVPDKTYAHLQEKFSEKTYAAVGATLLAAVEKNRGHEGVMEVMADPRTLLSAYNDCRESSTVKFQFDDDLAGRIANMPAAAH